MAAYSTDPVENEPWEEEGYDEYQLRQWEESGEKTWEKEEDQVYINTSVREYQWPCIEDVLNLWDSGMPAIITAIGGAGKTYMATAAAELWGADYVVVIGPKASLPKWRLVLGQAFSPDKTHVVTPQSWIKAGPRGYVDPRNGQPPHPFVYKEERHGKKGYDFFPSDRWEYLAANHRVVFIVDEFHAMQKPSQTTFATSACTRNILLNPYSQSRVLFLSFTPIDDLQFVPVHMYMMGVIMQSEEEGENPAKAMVEYSQATGRYKLTGLEDTMRYVESLGHNIKEYRDQAILLQYAKGRHVHKTANEIAGRLFMDFIRPTMVTSCTPDFVTNPDIQPVYRNVFCKVTPQTSAVIQAILGGGSAPPEEKELNLQHEHADDGSSYAEIMKKRQRMEKVKEMIYAQRAASYLEANPTGKVAVMVGFLDTLDEVHRHMQMLELSPVKMEGCMRENARTASLDAFKAYNLDCRAFVGTLQTGGVSIDLHDTSPGGQFPRLIMIAPPMKVKDLIQGTCRTLRDGTTSRSTIEIIYTADPTTGQSLENDFYTKVWAKSNVVKQYHAEGQNSILPCDYPVHVTEETYDTYIDYENEIEQKLVTAAAEMFPKPVKGKVLAPPPIRQSAQVSTAPPAKPPRLTRTPAIQKLSESSRRTALLNAAKAGASPPPVISRVAPPPPKGKAVKNGPEPAEPVEM